MIKVAAVFLMIIFSGSNLSAQLFDRTNGCIIDTLETPENVFTRFEIAPRFRGNMQWFLTKNIHIDKFLDNIDAQETYFADTAKVRFIITRKGEIGAVSITDCNVALFEKEVFRLFRLSSCSWEPGLQGSRYVNGWFQFYVILRVERRYGSINASINYTEISPGLKSERDFQ
jgi:hypothetical protein